MRAGLLGGGLMMAVLLLGCGGAVPFEPFPEVAVAPGPAPGHAPDPAPAPPPSTEPTPTPVPLFSDPLRGAVLFASIPRPGLLGCADCHSENPVVRNFGNIFVGRNAVTLIQRAVSSNTGGMGYLGNLFSAADFADIAAYLGNTPGALSFSATPTGGLSAAQSITINASTKVGIDDLQISTQGDFAMSGSTCASGVARLSACRLDVLFKPARAGAHTGAVLISHRDTPLPIRIVLTGSGV